MRAWSLFLAAGCLVLAGGAAAFEQRQGPAVLRLDARRGKDGRAEVPLAGTTLQILVRGKAPLHDVRLDDAALARSKSWKIRPVSRAGPEGNLRTWEGTYHLEPLGKPGDTADLDVAVRFREGDAPEQTVSWRIPARVTTEVTDVSLGAMRPATPPEQVPPAPSWRETAAWVEVALALAAVVLILGELVRRRFRRTRLLTPAAWAERELGRLAALDLAAAGAVERFPTLVSDVLRRYLELRFRLPASRQTTAEFLAAMQEAPELTAPQQAMLRDFLQTCDLAKFARATLPPEECRSLRDRAREFVRETGD